MNERERSCLALVADDAWKTKYDALSSARHRAFDALFRAKTMGPFAGSGLIAQRERELKAANLRLREWVLANPTSCSPDMLKEAQEADHRDRLADRIARG
jgi:hypothetical protein